LSRRVELILITKTFAEMTREGCKRWRRYVECPDEGGIEEGKRRAAAGVEEIKWEEGPKRW
jgi:hypothetical protein